MSLSRTPTSQPHRVPFLELVIAQPAANNGLTQCMMFLSSSDDMFLSFSFTIQFPILSRPLVCTAR